jgi:putative glycosyltransferase (TIGR04372 family)
MAETASEYSYESNLRRDGVTLVKNSSEEILELVQEMLARIDGTFRETEEDTRRRARFEKIRVLSTGIWERGNIGTAFLRRYEHLLD